VVQNIFFSLWTLISYSLHDQNIWKYFFFITTLCTRNGSFEIPTLVKHGHEPLGVKTSVKIPSTDWSWCTLIYSDAFSAQCGCAEGKTYVIYDVCFNRTVVESAMSVKPLKVFIIDLAFAWLSQKYKTQLSSGNFSLSIQLHYVRFILKSTSPAAESQCAPAKYWYKIFSTSVVSITRSHLERQLTCTVIQSRASSWVMTVLNYGNRLQTPGGKKIQREGGRQTYHSGWSQEGTHHYWTSWYSLSHSIKSCNIKQLWISQLPPHFSTSITIFTF